MRGFAVTRINPPYEAVVLPRADWRRAGRCGPDGGNCVEVNLSAAGLVVIRDSKQASSPRVVVSDHQWQQFLAALRTGRFARCLTWASTTPD